MKRYIRWSTLVFSLLVFPKILSAQLPVEWPLDEIKNVDSLGLEILNGCDAGGCYGITIDLCLSNGQWSYCTGAASESFVNHYQVYIVRYNGQANSAIPGGFEKIYAMASIPFSALDGTQSFTGTLGLHGYPFLRSSDLEGFINIKFPQALGVNYLKNAWSLAIFAPGFGVVKDNPAQCVADYDPNKDLSKYEYEVGKTEVYDNIFLKTGPHFGPNKMTGYESNNFFTQFQVRSDLCELVSDFSQGHPCIGTWMVADSTAPKPDLTMLPNAYAYAAMRSITLMKALPFTNKIVVEGGSFGALTSYIVNGVDDRPDGVIAAIAVGDLQTSLNAGNSVLANILIGSTGMYPNNPLVQAGLDKMDPIHYAAYQHAPLLILMGGEDPLFPTASMKNFFEAVVAPDKRLHVQPDSPHSYSVNSVSPDQVLVWYRSMIDETGDLPPLIDSSLSLLYNQKCGIFNCSKTRIQVDPITMSAVSATPQARISNNGTDWPYKGDWGQVYIKNVNSQGMANWDGLTKANGMVEASYQVNTVNPLTNTSESLSFKQTDIHAQSWQSFLYAFPPKVAACAMQMPACFNTYQIQDCNLEMIKIGLLMALLNINPF